jgi:hypothetical protein
MPYTRSKKKKLNEVLKMATLVAKNTNKIMVTPMVGSGGIWNQAVGFGLVRLAGILL